MLTINITTNINHRFDSMNLTQKYHGLPGIGVTGKKGSSGKPAGKIYFVTSKNFTALFDFSEITITKYVYHIINNKFTNDEQIEFYLGGDENTTSGTILNRQNYQYYSLSYSNDVRNTHNMRNFSIEDKSSYFIIKDTSDDVPNSTVDSTDINKSRIYLDKTNSSQNTNYIPIDQSVTGVVGTTLTGLSESAAKNAHIIVRDSFGNVIYSHDSSVNDIDNLNTNFENNNDTQYITYEHSYKVDDYENSDDLISVKLPNKLRNIFKAGDIIYIKTSHLDKDSVGSDTISDDASDKDYNMLYVTDELVSATYQKILDNVVEEVFVKYPYLYDDIYKIYHINLRNIISSLCFDNRVFESTLSLDNGTTNEQQYKEFIEHNKKALETLISADNSYQFTIVNTPKTDIINNPYCNNCQLNTNIVHNNLITLHEKIVDESIHNENTEINLIDNKLSVWYNHNYTSDIISKLKSPDNVLWYENSNNGYFNKNHVFAVDGKDITNNNKLSKIFVDDPYVSMDLLTNVYVKDVLYDSNLNYEYGYLPAPTQDLFKVLYKQSNLGVVTYVNITIPNTLIFNNLKESKKYKIGYFIKYKNNGNIERGYIENNKLTILYKEKFVFTYFIETINKSFTKYSKSVLVTVKNERLTDARKFRVKNMINVNVTLTVEPVDTFDILPDELLLYTYDKITYDTNETRLQIEINPEIENGEIKTLEIYGIKDEDPDDFLIEASDEEIERDLMSKIKQHEPIIDEHAVIGFERVDDELGVSLFNNPATYECVDNKKRIDIQFRTSNKPYIGIFKYFYNELSPDSYYKLHTEYKINYRDYIDERILVHHNKVDLRRRPKFKLSVEKNGNTLEAINSFNNGVQCNKFVTYLYLDIEDFDSKYWYTDDTTENDATLDVTISLNNNISSGNKNTVNRAFFKSFNKSKTDINVKITDITDCKTVEQQNLKVENENGPIKDILFVYTYNEDDITSNYESGLLIVNKGNARYKSEYGVYDGDIFDKDKNNLDFTIKGLTYNDKHLKFRIDIELSNPVLSNMFMQWQVTEFVINCKNNGFEYSSNTDSENYSYMYKFDYLPLKFNMTANNNNQLKSYDANCYIQTNTAYTGTGRSMNEKNDYILYIDNPDICNEIVDKKTNLLTFEHTTLAFMNDMFERYSNDVKIFGTINESIYVVLDASKTIEKTICKSNAFNICINPLELVAGRNDETIDYISNRNVRFYGSTAQIQVYAGFIESDYEFNNYVDLNNYMLYKKYFQDNVNAITIESTGAVKLMVKYNAQLFKPTSRFNNSVFYYNDEELEVSRYDKAHPLYFTDVNHSLVIRDDKLLESMKAWNETYEKMSSLKTMSFTGNISKYSNGYMLLQIKAKKEKVYYYYNVIGKYKTEYFNKISYNINDHQFDDKGLYTLTQTQTLNNVIVNNDEIKTSLYRNIEQPLIPTMYQPLRDHYFRSLMYDIDWIYRDSLGEINSDKDYSKHFVLYPRIAFNTAYDSVNVLMLRQPITNEKKYYFYNGNDNE